MSRRRSSKGAPAWGLWALGGAAVVAVGWWLLRPDESEADAGESTTEVLVSGGGGTVTVQPAAAPADGGLVAGTPGEATTAPVRPTVPGREPTTTTTRTFRSLLGLSELTVEGWPSL